MMTTYVIADVYCRRGLLEGRPGTGTVWTDLRTVPMSVLITHYNGVFYVSCTKVQCRMKLGLRGLRGLRLHHYRRRRS
jgi:hypothetical protein